MNLFAGLTDRELRGEAERLLAKPRHWTPGEADLHLSIAQEEIRRHTPPPPERNPMNEPTHIIRDSDQAVRRGTRVTLLTERDPEHDVGRMVFVDVQGAGTYSVDRSSLKPIWAMPDWMEQYRDLFTNTGGNSVEELVNSVTDVRINLPLAVLSACADSQIGLLTRLHSAGHLNTTAGAS